MTLPDIPVAEMTAVYAEAARRAFTRDGSLTPALLLHGGEAILHVDTGAADLTDAVPTLVGMFARGIRLRTVVIVRSVFLTAAEVTTVHVERPDERWQIRSTWTADGWCVTETAPQMTRLLRSAVEANADALPATAEWAELAQFAVDMGLARAIAAQVERAA